MHLDGEPYTESQRVHFEVRPRAVRVLVPAGGWPTLFSDDTEPEEGEPS
jgi:hypothetical protein